MDISISAVNEIYSVNYISFAYEISLIKFSFITKVADFYKFKVFYNSVNILMDAKMLSHTEVYLVGYGKIWTLDAGTTTKT